MGLYTSIYFCYIYDYDHFVSEAAICLCVLSVSGSVYIDRKMDTKLKKRVHDSYKCCYVQYTHFHLISFIWYDKSSNTTTTRSDVYVEYLLCCSYNDYEASDADGCVGVWWYEYLFVVFLYLFSRCTAYIYYNVYMTWKAGSANCCMESKNRIFHKQITLESIFF